MISVRLGVRRSLWRLALAALATLMAPTIARAGADPVALGVPASVGTVLYEVTENMYLVDASNTSVPPAAAAFRMAVATLQGAAKLGSPLCPNALLITNPQTKTCSITATGSDRISLTTGLGTVSGTYSIVVQGDNPVDAPEYVVQTGSFHGDMDLSTSPLGTVAGIFTPTGTALTIPFTGRFRLPFSVVNGTRRGSNVGDKAFYLADDGVTLIPVQSVEMSLGWPTVRLELTFQ